MTKYLNLIAAALLSAALPVLAHEGMHGPGSKFDADESGGLSVQEFKAYLVDARQDARQADARFKVLDANKDGELSSAEFIKGLPKQDKAK